jgi:hypothetical protein
MCEQHDLQLVLDPCGSLAEPFVAPNSGVRVEGNLRGKRVGIIDNLLAGMSAIGDALESELVDHYDVAGVARWTVPQSTAPTRETVVVATNNVDCMVIGLGNCGACTTWGCRFSAELRKVIPTLDVVTAPFELLARNSFRGHGLPEQPIVVLRAHAEEANESEMKEFARVIARACASELTTARG